MESFINYILKANKWTGVVLVLLLIGLLGAGYYVVLHSRFSIDNSSVNSYEECIQAGYEVFYSNPPVCRTPDGRSFTQK